MPRTTDHRQPAEALAIQALGYLAEEPERLARFLALSGLDAGEIRSAAAEPGFLAGVLDYLCADEALLTDFAASIGAAPAEVARAHGELTGGHWQRDIP
ncbi:MAG TPA: DUF3572 domain-containing protein [Xanthobacteraceae bacterium]|nr:DUF3572 domain-containing protein [Xanthobacteraceae bacterium]